MRTTPRQTLSALSKFAPLPSKQAAAPMQISRPYQTRAALKTQPGVNETPGYLFEHATS